MDGIPDSITHPALAVAGEPAPDDRAAVTAAADATAPRATRRFAWPRATGPLNGYGVALLATAGLLLVRLALDDFLKSSSPFLFFAPAVMLSAWYGGRGPGLFATVAGALAANYFLLGDASSFSRTPEDLTKTAVFLVVGAQISWLSGALHAAKGRAESDALAARRGEQLYRTLAQNFPHGAVFLLDNRMRVALAEGQALAAAGLDSTRLLGLRLSRAIPGDVLKPLLPAMNRPAGGATEVAFGGRVYLVQVLPLGGTAGRRFAGMGIAQDITELAAARAALQAAHDDLEVRVRERTAELEFRRTLLEAQSDASLDGILVADHHGRIIFRNRRVAELWGLPDAAFAGSRDRAVLAMRSALAQPQDPLGDGADVDAPRAELPANLVLRDGRTLECYGAPVDSAEGRSYGRAWYFRDVTERRRTSRQILEAGERERHRIGQDLHDDLCQHLTGIACLGRVLHQRLLARLPAEAPAASQVVDLVEQAVRRARDIARGLQPLQLATDGIAPALQELAANVGRMFPIRCHFACDRPVAIEDPACPIQLYRITQEAITNAVRHGRAANVYVDLVEVEGRVILTIEDDGVGIGNAATARPGLGLRTMRHRARMIGATLAIESAEGGGTIVTCKLPVRPATAAAPRGPTGVSDVE
jgi:signal transduction histidine kinase